MVGLETGGNAQYVPTVSAASRSKSCWKRKRGARVGEPTELTRSSSWLISSSMSDPASRDLPAADIVFICIFLVNLPEAPVNNLALLVHVILLNKLNE